MVSEGPCSASAAAVSNETHQVVRAYSSIEKTGKRVPVRCRVPPNPLAHLHVQDSSSGDQGLTVVVELFLFWFLLFEVRESFHCRILFL